MRKLLSVLSFVASIVGAGCIDAPSQIESLKAASTYSPHLASARDGVAPAACNLQMQSNRFAHPVFPWVRTGTSVSLERGLLSIQPDGVVDDGMAAPCTMRSPWTLEVTGRLISGGNNYVFPHVYGQFSDGRWFIANLLPDLGWMLMVCNRASWLETDVVPGHTPPEICTEPRWATPALSNFPVEGEELTLQVSATTTHLRVSIKRKGEKTYTLGREIAFATTGLNVRRVGVSQPWDSHIEVTGMRAR